MKAVAGLILILSFILWMGTRCVKAYQFSVDCTQHMSRAAHANSVELAKKEMEVVVKYLEDRKLTSGIVSIFLHQPMNDIGFWYSNMKASLDELVNLKPDATPLEKSNCLMKLRETLLTNGENGSSIVCPDGISIYPNNVAYSLWCIIGIIFFGIGCYLIIKFLEDL